MHQRLVATAAATSQWLLSDPMRKDLAKDGIDFARLKGPRPITCYVIMAAHALETFSAWLRLVVACAFNALYRTEDGGGLRTLFWLSEMAQLGKLSMINSALAQGRGYGLQLLMVLQDLNQPRAIYGQNEANTFLGMSSRTFAFTPNDPETAEWMSRRSGERTVPGLSTSDDPQTGMPRETWRGDRQRNFQPHELYNLPQFHAMLWSTGQSLPQMIYAPPYFDRADNRDLRGRYDKNPYHP